MPDLSQSFGRPATAKATLGGLLPRRTTPAPADEVAEETAEVSVGATDVADSQPAEQPVEESLPPTVTTAGSRNTETARSSSAPDSAPVSPRPRTPSRRLRPAPAMVSQSQTFQVPTYVRAQVKTAAQQRRSSDLLTNAELAFEAIDATFSDLHQMLQQRRTAPRRADSLFPPRRRRVQGTSAQPDTRVVPWVIQATADEIAVLDGLVSELGAESRSELIAVALEAHLLGRR